jgi:alpha 1,2-mannosyltransferase
MLVSKSMLHALTPRQIRQGVAFAIALVTCLLVLTLTSSFSYTYSVVQQGVNRWGPSSTTLQLELDRLQSHAVPVHADNTSDDFLGGATFGSDGNWYPPVYTKEQARNATRMNAAFVILVRNSEVYKMAKSMQSLEARFNHKYNYPYVFLNEVPFTESFKNRIRTMTHAQVQFGVLPKEHWSYPDWISQEKAAETRKQMKADNVLYGASESYRHMCRFQSGFFFRHPLVEKLDYYWRVEPGVTFHCDIVYDPFRFMHMNNKTYGFNVALYESKETVATLYSTTRDFLQAHPEYIDKNAGMRFLSTEPDTFTESTGPGWNLCHFWSNFEIAATRLWQSKAYLDYFDYLDKAGGFFYERWGDAPVHSIAAMLFQDVSHVHRFDDIGYTHKPYTHCPQHPQYHNTNRCSCQKGKVSAILFAR